MILINILHSSSNELQQRVMIKTQEGISAISDDQRSEELLQRNLLCICHSRLLGSAVVNSIPGQLLK